MLAPLWTSTLNRMCRKLLLSPGLSMSSALYLRPETDIVVDSIALSENADSRHTLSSSPVHIILELVVDLVPVSDMLDSYSLPPS